jgi:hypothetical protein
MRQTIPAEQAVSGYPALGTQGDHWTTQMPFTSELSAAIELRKALAEWLGRLSCVVFGDDLGRAKGNGCHP